MPAPLVPVFPAEVERISIVAASPRKVTVLVVTAAPLWVIVRVVVLVVRKLAGRTLNKSEPSGVIVATDTVHAECAVPIALPKLTRELLVDDTESVPMVNAAPIAFFR